MREAADLLERLAVERDGAVSRALLILNAKNEWCDRALVAEANLAKREAELTKADVVIAFYHDFDHYEGGRSATADEEKWDNEAMERHAARKKQKV